MALSNIEKHYNKHPEDLRLQRRHGIVEFETTMYHLRRLLRPGMLLLDIGAGTGRYASALMAEGYKVKAVDTYGPAIKDIIHEQGGNAIMSAIDFGLDVDVTEDAEGNHRVIIKFDGKLLPYAKKGQYPW